MANRPANAGAHSAGPQQGPAAAPPPVHHQDFPRSRTSQEAAATQEAATQEAAATQETWIKVVAAVPYLIVLGGAVAGLFVAWQGSGNATRGAGIVGAALLVASVARLVLPPRFAGLLVSRGKAQDVAAFAVLGAAVLAVAVSLP